MELDPFPLHIATLVLSILLALVMLGTGVMKLIHAPRVVGLMEAVHVTRSQTTALGLIDVAATVGLIAGIWIPPLAVAAAIGVIIYFVGAIIAHLRAGERGMQGTVAFLTLAVATLVLLLLGS